MYEKKNLSPLNGRGKMNNLSQILRAYNSQMYETILLKFSVLGAESGIYSWCGAPAYLVT